MIHHPQNKKRIDIFPDCFFFFETSFISNLLLMVGLEDEAREKCWFWWYCWLPAGPDRVCWTGGRATTGVLPRLVNALDVRMASACF